MFLLIPWKVDVPQDRRPVVNWLIIVATIGVFCLQLPDLLAIMEQGSRLTHGMPGAKAEIGNVRYLLLYIFFGLAAFFMCAGSQ
jgi:hypothetical protein